MFLSSLSCEIIQAAKQVGVYLLQTFGCPNFQAVNKRTFKQGVGFGLLSIYALITVGKPFYKTLAFCSETLSQRKDAVIINITQTLLPSEQAVSSG